MLYIFITILILLGTSLIHVFLYRTVGEKTIWGTKLFAVYLVGFVAEAVAVFWLLPYIIKDNFDWWSTPLPLSSVLFYLLCTGMYFIFYISAFLGDESPATKIFRQIRKNGRATDDDLVKSFSDKKLVIKRIDEMTLAGWVVPKRGLYRLAPRGLYIMKIINIYQRILKWKRSG